MLPKRIFWQFFTSTVATVLCAVLILGGMAFSTFRQFHLREVGTELAIQARFIAAEIGRSDAGWKNDAVRTICAENALSSKSRITIIDPDGVVIADSEGEPSRMENHSHRPEFEAALAGGAGQSVRFSETVRVRQMYVAVPVRYAGRIVGAVRASLPLTAIDWALKLMFRQLLFASTLVTLALAGIIFWLSHRITRPLDHMRQGAERYARGELDRPISVEHTGEVGELAGAMNLMAGQLSGRIQDLSRQRAELEAILAGMVEGIVLVDCDERILNVNRAACAMLNVPADQARGRLFREVVRNPALQQFIAGVLKQPQFSEKEFVLHGAEDLFLQVHGTPLNDTTGWTIGALMVMNDITRLKKLENMRRDFVANMSHELKTPITSIRSAAETIQDTAGEKYDEVRTFIDIIARQSGRLATLVEDLLRLSRIEFEAERGRITVAHGAIKPVLRSALQNVRMVAEQRRILLNLECDDSLAAGINTELLEQAIVNLVDNAIKYSPDGSAVDIRATRAGDSVAISIADHGIGIEAQHLSRIFERFYRVDTARSRVMGGTGLGLAIVKHIAIAHRGSVTVESTPGKGSTFTFRMPIAG